MSFSPSEYTKIDVDWALPQTLLGSLEWSPDHLAGFKGAASRQEGNGVEGMEGLGEGKRGREGNGGSWGNSALVVGDRRPWTPSALIHILFVSLHVTLYSAIQHLCCNYVNKTQFSSVQFISAQLCSFCSRTLSLLILFSRFILRAE